MPTLRSVIGLCIVLLGGGCERTRPADKGVLALTSHALDGTELSIWDLRGKVVVLGFVASWCPPSRSTVLELQRFRQLQTSDDVAVVAVDVDERPDTMRAFLDPMNLSLTVIWDENAKLSGAFELEAMPAIVVVDRLGVVRFVHEGKKVAGELQEVASESEQLLQQMPPDRYADVPLSSPGRARADHGFMTWNTMVGL